MYELCLWTAKEKEKLKFMEREAIYPEDFYNMYFICFKTLHHSQALQQLFEFSYFTVMYTLIDFKKYFHSLLQLNWISFHHSFFSIALIFVVTFLFKPFLLCWRWTQLTFPLLFYSLKTKSISSLFVGKQ